MQKFILCIACISLSTFGFGQLSLLFTAVDTLNYQNRVGGERLDSLDLYYTGNPQGTPGGAAYHPFGVMQNNFIGLADQLKTPFLKENRLKREFSALPHLGFMYSFGTKGVQFLHTDFQRQLNEKTSLQFLLQQNSMGEMMRNGDFKNRNVQAQLLHDGKRYRFGLDLCYQSSDLSLNNGLVDSVSANAFPVEFLAVNNNEAFSKIKQFRLATEHFIDFNKDSTRFVGLLYKNQWSLANREYSDSLNMDNKYDVFYHDSLHTRDQHQLASFQNALGFAIQDKKMTLEAYAQLKYWDFQNISSHLDTTEFTAHVNASYKQANWSIKNEAFVNLAGALGEMSEKLTFSYRKKKIHAVGILGFENKLPAPFQRRYLANSNSWKLNNYETQQIFSADLGFLAKNKFQPGLKASFRSYSNAYYYFGDKWRNDTLSLVQLLQLNATATIPLKSFGIKFNCSVNPLASTFDYVPLLDLRSRIYFQKKLFKAKKFDFICAIDVKYQSTCRLMQYNPALGIYSLNDTPSEPQLKSDWLELDFYTGFQIDEFRFYIKIENIDYSWLNRDIQVVKAYPLAPRMFRLGLTWDFFN